jgi:ATP phosphoribosyltransferase
VREKFQGLELDIQEQFGENIPGLVDSLRDDPYPIVGITGEDLLDNFLLQKYGADKRIRWREDLLISELDLRGEGPYEKAVFGLPALCILSERGFSLDEFIRAYPEARDFKLQELKGPFYTPDFSGKRVALPTRYENLIRYLVGLDNAEILSLEGKADVTAARGEADYAIDIVLSGRTCREQGLGFFLPVLYLSDGVVLGNGKTKGKPKRPAPEFSPFELWLNTGRVPRPPGVDRPGTYRH